MLLPVFVLVRVRVIANSSDNDTREVVHQTRCLHLDTSNALLLVQAGLFNGLAIRGIDRPGTACCVMSSSPCELVGKMPGQLNYTNNWSYQFAIGADHKLKGRMSRMDWRVIEAKAGFLGNFVAGANTNNNNYIVTVGTGLVVRMGGK